MEIDRSTYSFHLTDPSQVGEARRTASRVAGEIGLRTDRSDVAALLVTEMATNLIKHAKEGTLLIQPIGTNGSRGLQILSMDKGPGIENVSAAFGDGFSSSGTLGGGFGAMRRLSDAFDLYTQAGTGTVVLCETWRNPKNPDIRRDMDIGVISTPYPGESINGDRWLVRQIGEVLIFVVVDGLGHGVLAAEAAGEAERIVLESTSNSPVILLEDCHRALAKTRGAAIGIAALPANGRNLTFAGTGNIAGSISTTGLSRGLASHNGTLGHVMSRAQEFTYPWTEDSLLILHSDGLSMRWNLDNYPGLRLKHPSIIAAVLHRDFARGRDDATVLVARRVSP